MDNLNDLYLFVRVVEARGFSAAERATGIAKSRLSRRIAALEARLGARLVHRDTHSFDLTPLGETVYRHARNMVAEAENVRLAVDDAQTEPSGVLRVNASLLMGETILGGFLAEFAKRYPKVRIHLTLTNRYVDLIAERIDLAFRAASGPLESEDVVAREIGLAPNVLVASPESIARCGDPADLAALVALPSLAYGTPQAPRNWRFVSPAGDPVEHAVDPVFIAENFVALREAALAGLGYAQLPLNICATSIAQGRLVEVMRAWSSQPAKYYAIYPSRRGTAPAIRMLIEFVKEKLEIQFRSVSGA
ncbi:LysR substrate-binding domain-containing protein [Paraburkholderia sp. BR14374]|uniref:LysR substrate-binding domain-containing protein n=1 Tax=Paraburkholderia sp. BR14374 TaxID=3237007 RepID=UPI0034CFB96C